MTDRTDKVADFLSLFLSFRGRLDRRRYWLVLIMAIAANIAATGSLLWLSAPFAIQLLAVFLFAFILLAIWAKRLHDFDFSGLWIIAILLLFGAVETLVEDGLGYLNYKRILPAINLLAASIVLGLIPGTPGPNRFDYNPSSETDPAT